MLLSPADTQSHQRVALSASARSSSSAAGVAIVRPVGAVTVELCSASTVTAYPACSSCRMGRSSRSAGYGV